MENATWYALYNIAENRPVIDYDLEDYTFVIHTDKFFFIDNEVYFPTETLGLNEDKKMYFIKDEGVFKVGFITE